MPHIFVLDENAESVTMLRAVLEQRGFQVMSGRSGEDGLRLLRHVIPDLIISNLLLPKMNGLDFLDEVRHNPDWAAIPFVMVTPTAAEDGRRASIEHGADAFLAKPFRFADLDKMLNNLGIAPARA